MSGLQIQTTQNTPKNPSSKSSSNPHRFGDIKAKVQKGRHFKVRGYRNIRLCEKIK